jgi:hypothetical protein
MGIVADPDPQRLIAAPDGVGALGGWWQCSGGGRCTAAAPDGGGGRARRVRRIVV